MEKETKEAIGWLACILIIIIALFSARVYLTPEDTHLEQLVRKFQTALQQDDKDALKKMFPINQQTEQLLDKLVNLSENITMDIVNVTYGGKHCGMERYMPCIVTYIGNVLLSRNSGKHSSATIVTKGRSYSLEFISLTPNDPNHVCHGSFAACFLDMVDNLPDNSDWKELQLKEVRKQFKLISFGLKRRYFNFVKNLMKAGIELDHYLKKNYKGISEIKVDHIDTESIKEILGASLLIRQGTEKVVAKIVMILNNDSPTGYIVDEGTICNGSDCSDE